LNCPEGSTSGRRPTTLSKMDRCRATSWTTWQSAPAGGGPASDAAPRSNYWVAAQPASSRRRSDGSAVSGEPDTCCHRPRLLMMADHDGRTALLAGEFCLHSSRQAFSKMGKSTVPASIRRAPRCDRGHRLPRGRAARVDLPMKPLSSLDIVLIARSLGMIS
jgi:hypothetical protein